MAGFVTRDSQGRVTFQLTDRIVRLFGTIEITGANQSGQFDIPAAENSGSPFYFTTMGEDPMGQSTGREVSLSGNRITWNAIPVGTRITYGLY